MGSEHRIIELSLWRRVAIYLLWKVLDLLDLIDRMGRQFRTRSRQPPSASEIRDIGPKRK